MSSYCYVAIDAHGAESRGTIDVAGQMEALRRIKEMGLFPTKVIECDRATETRGRRSTPSSWKAPCFGFDFKPARSQGRVSALCLTAFTRQLATLLEAGMPVLRGLRVLDEQEENRRLKCVIRDLCQSVENGSSFAEALAQHPRVFNRLYVNMVRAGEIGGALETALMRLAECLEKARKIRSKVISAMAYPSAVMVVAGGILTLLMVFVVPRFRLVFLDLMNGAPLPAFTRFVFGLSEALRHHLPITVLALVSTVFLLWLGLRTGCGRWLADRLKIALPIIGPLFRKAAISRFSRTLGSLLTNGVPILQALTIVRETSGNRVVARVVEQLHAAVKQGDPMAPTLRSAPVFPVLVAGMVDVGEQTGALPEMLLKVADTYDDQVDTAAGALTSLVEPVMILLLAMVVGGLVFAMFLPIIAIISGVSDTVPDRSE